MTLPHSLDPLDYPARYQFGQAGAPCLGKSCCTDACIQMLIEYWMEKTVSLADIRKAAQAKTNFDERPCTGINATETINALKAYGITWYQPALGINANFVASKLVNGPVLVAVGYQKYPNHVNKRCGPYNLAESGGRTDCTFRGAHAVLAIKPMTHTDVHTGLDIIVRDPDHNSPARPEKPKWDRFKLSQFQSAMTALVTDTPWTTTYCLYPTKKKTL